MHHDATSVLLIVAPLPVVHVAVLEEETASSMLLIFDKLSLVATVSAMVVVGAVSMPRALIPLLLGHKGGRP